MDSVRPIMVVLKDAWGVGDGCSGSLPLILIPASPGLVCPASSFPPMHPALPDRLAPPPRRRGRRRLPLPGIGSWAEPDASRARPCTAVARRGRGPARGHVAGADGTSRGTRRPGASAFSRGGETPRLAGPAGRDVGALLPMLLAEEGREVKGYLQLHALRPAGWLRSLPTALAAGPGIQGARALALGAPQRPGARASPGTGPARAASSATSSTASTMGSPPTSASWRG